MKKILKNWDHVSPIDLFEPKLVTILPDKNCPIVKNLERNAMECDKLILWTDCDREGEHIAFQIIDACKKVKPEIQIYRANFLWDKWSLSEEGYIKLRAAKQAS